jgi:hypothetical protein
MFSCSFTVVALKPLPCNKVPICQILLLCCRNENLFFDGKGALVSFRFFMVWSKMVMDGTNQTTAFGLVVSKGIINGFNGIAGDKGFSACRWHFYSRCAAHGDPAPVFVGLNGCARIWKQRCSRVLCDQKL